MNNIWVLTALALAPGLAIIIYIYQADKYEKEPKSALLGAFLSGVFSIIPAVALGELFDWMGFSDDYTTSSTFLYAFITVAFSEEFSKYWVFKKWSYSQYYFDEPYDGIIYAVMVSMGFATLENLLYVQELGFSVGVLRMFTAVPAHATFGVLMGYFAGIAKFKNDSFLFRIIGLMLAILFHGAYDFFLMVKNYEWMFLGAFISLIIAIKLSQKAIQLHQERSPFK
jgi:RsiW-degrading membrane proteinase PrsW (M82 family)